MTYDSNELLEVDLVEGTACRAGEAEALRGVDARAFEALVRAHSGRLLATARRLLRNEPDAHDALQETFLNAFRAIDGFEGGAQIGTWLHRILINACLMKMRSQRARPETPIETLLPQYLEDGHARSPAQAWREEPAAACERRELGALVRRCIEGLPEKHRVVLLLRDIEGLDTAEAAAALGTSENAVKIRLHRARQALRELLDPHLRDG